MTRHQMTQPPQSVDILSPASLVAKTVCATERSQPQVENQHGDPNCVSDTEFAQDLSNRASLERSIKIAMA